MKIGYDGKRAVLNNTGLGNYSRLAVEVLSERFPDNRYLLYTPRKKANRRLSTLEERDNVELLLPDHHFWNLAGSLWRSYGLTDQIIRDGVELFHGLSGELPLNIHKAGIPTVVTIHDLIFLRHPECYKPIDRRIYDHKFKEAARNATRVIAISERTRQDIVELYGINPAKIDVVYQGCAPQFHTRPTQEIIEQTRRKYGLIRPYIISVGTIEERKNQIQAVRGVRGLPGDIDVVLVGRQTPYMNTIRQYCDTYQCADRVKVIDNATFADLPALYAGAFCSSYTSRYEGFGIPVIESLSVGTPVVVANGSCLEEAGGPATPAVNPDDVEEWINVIKEMVNYPAIRRNIAEAGKNYVKRFSNESMADGIMATYLRAMNDFKQAR